MQDTTAQTAAQGSETNVQAYNQSSSVRGFQTNVNPSNALDPVELTHMLAWLTGGTTLSHRWLRHVRIDVPPTGTSRWTY